MRSHSSVQGPIVSQLLLSASLLLPVPLALATEGCINAEAVLMQLAIGDRNPRPEEQAFLESAEGRFLSAALKGDMDGVKRYLDSGGRIDVRDKRRRYREDSALNHAARTGNVELAAFLLSRGFDVNSRADEGKGWTALHVATGLGQGGMVDFLLSKGADPDVRDPRTGTPLEVAVLQARPSMARMLLKYGAKPSGPEGVSPLIAIDKIGTVCEGHAEIIKLLVSSGTDLFSENAAGMSGAYAVVWRNDDTAMVLARETSSVDWNKPVRWQKREVPLLMVAKCSNSRRTFEYLLTAHPQREIWRKSVSGSWGTLLHCPGDQKMDELLVSLLPDPNATDPDGRAPLHVARDPRLIQALLKRGADINAADKNGNTPIMLALRLNYDAFIELLADGADLSRANNNGMTVLDSAAASYNVSVMRMLLGHRPQPNEENRDGKTPLHFAMDPQVAEVLLEAGADINAKALDGQTPLHAAAERDSSTMIGFLLKKGADPIARSNDGRTPLHYPRRHESVAELLKSKPDSFDLLDNSGKSPLHYVGAAGTGAAIRLLVKNGAVVDRADKDGNTPLHIATARQYVYGVNYLIEAGANPMVPNKDGKSAFDLARASAKADELNKALRGETLPR